MTFFLSYYDFQGLCNIFESEILEKVKNIGKVNVSIGLKYILKLLKSKTEGKFAA